MNNKKGLAILMRTRMRPTETSKIAQSPLSNVIDQTLSNSNVNRSNGGVVQHDSNNTERDLDQVRQSMQSAITMHKTEVFDSKLNDFSQGYFSLNYENRRKLLLSLAKEYDLNRLQVRELMKQYLGIQLPSSEKTQPDGLEEESMLSSFYRIERNLRQALKPVYEVLFERLNTHPGGLKFLTTIRADILSILAEENIPSLRALDSYIKEKLGIVLCPASLELHQITWDDPASLLEKIVAYEAVHPISNLIDLKRRLGVGRRCFGYLHPAIPGLQFLLAVHR